MSTRSLHEIAVTLPDCYDLSSTIRKAEKEPNPRACGGNCDVTLGTISLAEMEGKHQLLSACTPGTTALKVAIKRARAWDFDKWSEDKQTAFIKRYARQIKIWSDLDHPNILRFLGCAYEELKFPSLITPWMENGTAKQYLQKNPSANKLVLTLDVINGLSYLHSRDIIHGDMKAENILISRAGTALLADFGVSRDTVSSDYAYLDTSSHSINGTLNWMAIEQLQATRPEERYSFATDIWSFGMTIYEFLTGNIPFSHINWTLGVLRAIMDCNSPHGPEEPSFNSEQEDGLWNICKLCWHTDPKDRPTAIALKGHLGTVPVQCFPRPETEHSPLGKSKQEKLNEIYATITRWKGEYAREHDNCPMTPINISESDKDQFNGIFKSLAVLADIIEKSLPFVPSLRKDVNTMELVISFIGHIALQRKLLKSSTPIYILDLSHMKSLYHYLMWKYTMIIQQRESPSNCPSHSEAPTRSRSQPPMMQDIASMPGPSVSPSDTHTLHSVANRLRSRRHSISHAQSTERRSASKEASQTHEVPVQVVHAMSSTKRMREGDSSSSLRGCSRSDEIRLPAKRMKAGSTPADTFFSGREKRFSLRLQQERLRKISLAKTRRNNHL